MEKEELIEKVAATSGVTKDEASRVFEEFVSAIKEGLLKGEKVNIAGFGTFSLSARKARTFLNPKSKTVHEIPKKAMPHFKASRDFHK